MIAPDHPFAVGQDGVAILDDTVGRQAAIAHREIHGAAADRHPEAELPRLIGLNVDRLLASRREEIVMVRHRGAARHQELGEREPCRQTMRVGRQPRPITVKRREPGKELLVDRLRMGARQGLIHMMMGIDEAGQDDMPACIECLIHSQGGLSANCHELGDLAVFNDQAATRAIGKTGERIADPQTHELLR